MFTSKHNTIFSPGYLSWRTFLFLWLCFWFFSRANFHYSVDDAPVITGLAESRPDDAEKTAALIALMLWSAYTLVFHRNYQTTIRPVRAAFIGLYSVWTFASVLWTDDLEMTVRKLAIFAATSLVAGALAYRFSFRDLAWLVFLGSFITNSIGIAAEIALHSFRPWDGTYRFSGLWHPNTHGVSLSMLILTGIVLFRYEPRYRSWLASITSVGVLMLLLTRSRASIGGTVIAVAVTYLLTSTQTRRWKLLFAGVTTSLVLALLGSNDLITLPTGMLAMGRQDSELNTLTNRVPLWKECFARIAERPWMGYGYGAFWTPARITTMSAPEETAWKPGLEMYVTENSYLPDAHNMLIETALNTGLIGVLLLGGGLIVVLSALGITLSRTGLPAVGLCFSVLLWFCLETTLEAGTPGPFLPTLLIPVILTKCVFVLEHHSGTRRRSGAAAGPEAAVLDQVQYA